MYPREQIRAALRLYAVTDNAWLAGRTLASCVREALAGGATFLQLRDKQATTEELIEAARTLMPIARAACVPFVINDDVQAALASGVDGVHVGQDDMACETARALLGPQKIVGVSVQTLDEALAAQASGADYLGVGAMFGTPTKPDAADVSFAELTSICAAVRIPVVAIGGLGEATVSSLEGCGVDGAAVVSAIFAAADIEGATRRLRALVDETIG